MIPVVLTALVQSSSMGYWFVCLSCQQARRHAQFDDTMPTFVAFLTCWVLKLAAAAIFCDVKMVCGAMVVVREKEEKERQKGGQMSDDPLAFEQ